MKVETIPDHYITRVWEQWLPLERQTGDQERGKRGLTFPCAF
jgi:hypothetical protein